MSASDLGAAPRGVSLTVRLVGAALVWMIVLLSAGGFVLTAAFRDSVVQEFGQRLDAQLRAMIAATEIGRDGTVVAVGPFGDPRFEQIFSGWYWQVAEPSGRLIRSRSLWDSTLPTHDGGANGQLREIAGPNSEALLAAERDLRFDDAAAPVHMVIAGNLGELDERIRSFNLLLFSALGVFAVGVIVAIVLQVHFGLGPLRRMAVDLDAIRGGRAQRLSEPYPREVAPLAQAMNAVLDHDADLIERARTHLGNLAHSLKTPLAVLRVELSETPGKRAETSVVATQIATMTRLIEYHMARAAATAGSARALGMRTDVAPVAAAIAEVLARIHSGKTIAVTLDIGAEVSVSVARADLDEMLGNLMENAWKWARGRVRVSAASNGDGWALWIEDDGSGLSPEEAATASARGARLDEATPGWGLGLAIVSDLAALNEGTLTIERSDLGGVRAVLCLPKNA